MTTPAAKVFVGWLHEWRTSCFTVRITRIEQLKTMIWRYYMSYWNNRRICSSIGGVPPAENRRRYYSDKTGKSAADTME